MSEPTQPKRIYRSRDEKMLAGVCGGVAEYMDMDPTIIRLLWAGSVIFAGFGIIMYILATIIVPIEPIKANASTTAAEANNN